MVDLLILMIAIPCLAVGAVRADEVMHEVIRRLPGEVARDGANGRHVHSTYIFTPATPKPLRSRYLRSIAFAGVGIVCLTILAWLHDFPPGKIGGSLLSAIWAIGFIDSCRRYRASDHW